MEKRQTGKGQPGWKKNDSIELIGCTPSKKTYFQMNLSWGIKPVMINEETDTEELFNNSMKAAQLSGYIKKDELAVITAGVPLGISGTTNIIRVIAAE